jgi:hypothetical protein
MKWLLRAVVVMAALAVVAQFIPVARTNPPAQGAFSGPPGMMALLKPACYDCHSHETVWPWYSRIAPASWLVANDVKEGRRHLNFSAWTAYEPKKQKTLLHMAADEVDSRDMPPKPYTWMHAGARLTDEQIEALKDAFETAAGD